MTIRDSDNYIEYISPIIFLFCHYYRVHPFSNIDRFMSRGNICTWKDLGRVPEFRICFALPLMTTVAFGGCMLGSPSL